MAHNNWFQFKQFTVQQNNAAMRVGTDGVLLGTWTQVENATNILDIGTGTGVIALILAQRSSATIDAIDLDEGAIADAQLNFRESPWNDRLTAVQSSLQQYTETASEKYNCIVCNPPFFNNAVKSKNENRAMARHTHSLSFDDIARGVSKLLDEDGCFSLVLPAEAEKEFRSIAANYRLFASKITRVKPKPSKTIVRVLMEFQFDAKMPITNELTLETETHHEYTLEFSEMVKEFYLKL